MNCRDERFINMIYAYELGLLRDKERREFEMHLLDCESCFEDAQQFKSQANLLKHDPDIQKSVQHFLEEQGIETAKAAKKSVLFVPGKFIKAFVPVAAAAAILIFLILKDWQFEIRPTQEAVAVENKLAVMYFDNLAEPTDSLRYGDIITNLLITDLTESHYMQVVSSQRLYDILRLLGKEGTKSINRDMATQIAVKANARWMLIGGIIQTEPQFIFTYQLIEVSSGDAIAARQIEGGPDDNMFTLADRLTAEIKADLTLPSEALQEPDPAIANVTTHSEEAYRFYLKGIEDYHRLYYDEAIASFKKAVEIDSTFAMAYYYLARLVDVSYVTNAVKYSENATRMERLYIRSLEASRDRDYDRAMEELREIIKQYPDEKDAYYRLGLFKNAYNQYDSAIALLKSAIAIDSFYKPVYNQLAYSYNQIGEYEKSLWAINKYIDMAPDEANPYDTRGEIYALNGNLDGAIESYIKALEIKPDFYSSLNYLGMMYLFKHDYVRADSCFRILTTVDNARIRAAGRMYLSFTPVQQGKFQEAIKILDAAIKKDSLEQIMSGSANIKYLMKARIYAVEGNFETALDEYESYLAIIRQGGGQDIGERFRHIQFLVDSGDINEAEKMAESLKVVFEKDSINLMHHYWFSTGYIEFAKGNYDAAVENFARTVETTDHPNSFFYFIGHIMLGRSYLESGQLGEAVREFEKLMSEYTSTRACWGDWSVKMHYYLGQAYEQSGWDEQAIEQYETFLDIWKNADPGIKEIEDAEQRLRRLKNRT